MNEKKVCGQVDRVKCEQCSSEFSDSQSGHSDTKDHMKCAKHKASLAAASSS
jgi:hypothetical protein